MPLLSFYSNSQDAKAKSAHSTTGGLEPSISTSSTSSASILSPDDEDTQEKHMFEAMRVARHILDLFLDSRIAEAEALLDPKLCKTSMYYALAKSVLLTLKSMMTFQQADFEVAIDALKHTVQLSTNIIRKGHGSLWFLDGITSWIKSGTTVEQLKKMRPLYRHAVK